MATEALGPLSLPESMALIGGERVDRHEVVFLTLLELVVRGGVELVAPARAQDEYRLLPREHGRDLARPLAHMCKLIDEARGHDPRVGTESPANKYVQRRFAARWGTAGGYVRLEVWTTLRERGLSGPNGMPIAQIWDLTPSGKAERTRILGCGTKEDWRERPATTLLHAAGLAVPSGETFDILDEVEGQITPGVEYSPLDAVPWWGP